MKSKISMIMILALAINVMGILFTNINAEKIMTVNAEEMNEYIQNSSFEYDLDNWRTTGTVETSTDAHSGGIAAQLGANSELVQTVTGIEQGSYTLNVWVKGTGTGNTSYIKAADCGGPDATSTVDTYINETSYTQITLRNVLVYNGQCTVKVYSGEGCSLLVDDFELVKDSGDDNPLLNWNFEDEDALNNWNTEGEVSVSENADTGNNAVKLEPNSEISQTISVKPNTRYIATARAKVDTQDVWEQENAYDSENRHVGHNLTLKSIGDRVNLGVRGADGTVIRQAPAGNEGYCLLTISFKTGAEDNEVTIYANTIYDENYIKSVSLYGKKADPDKWSGNKGNAYVDNFDVFEKDDSVITGTDVSYLGIIEDVGGRYFANGVQQDCLRIMSNHGVNAINGMIFVRDGEESIIPGTNKVKRVLPKGFGKYYWYELAKRAKDLDMKYMANFMLSDTWMNAIQAYTPKDWMKYNAEKDIWDNQSLEEMTTTMYNYIYDFLDGLVKQDTAPIAVKIGNEEDGGILWGVGKDIKSEGFRKLINAAYDAAHDVIPEVPVHLHTYKGYDPKGAKGFFDAVSNNNVKYDGHSYSIYGNRDIYNILNMMNQDVTVDPYADTLYVETGYTVTTYNPDWADAMANGVQKNVSNPIYWATSPNGQYNYLLDFAQSFRDIPNPHSIMRGFFYWSSEWYAIEGAGEETTAGNICDRQNLYNNGDVTLKDMGSTADGKQGDMLEGMYAYLWRGKAKDKQATAKNPMKSFKSNNYVVTNTTPQSVEFDETDITIAEGEKKRLHTTITPTDKVYNWNLKWSSSDENTVKVAANGFITGIAPGKATITVTTEEGNLTAETEVTVTAAIKNSQLSVFADDIQVNSGKTVGITKDDCIILKPVTDAAAFNQTVKYTSSNPEVASFMSENWNATMPGILYHQTNITPQVQLDAKSEGATTITVETADGGASESFTVEVTDGYVDVPATGISISENEAEIGMGQSKLLKAVVYPKNTSNRIVTWSSSNSDIASVDSSGRVNGLKTGTAIITASTADGNIQESCNVTIFQTDEIERELTIGEGITLDNEIYVWPTKLAAVTADFSADKGTLTTEFDLLLRKDRGKYTMFTIEDSKGTSLITWKCFEYETPNDEFIVQVGDQKFNDKATATKGTVRDTTETFNTYTHMKCVIDLDKQTAALFVGGEEIAEGVIDSKDVSKLTISSNHVARPVKMKGLSIKQTGTEEPPQPSEENDITEFVYDGGNQHVSIISKKNMDAVVIHAEYNEDGSLRNVKCINTALKEGENKVDILASSGDKIMLWSSLEEMKPLTESLLID